MKKLILLFIVALFIGGCKSGYTYSSTDVLVITSAEMRNLHSEFTRYNMEDKYGFSYLYIDSTGKFSVGDTVKIVKK